MCLSAQTPASAPSMPAGAAVAQTVYGIISFSRWPVEREAVRLCIIMPSAYADDLRHRAAEAPGKPVQVKRLNADDPRVETDCDAVYLGTLSDGERRQLFQRLKGHAVLSISEHDDACALDSQFCLSIVDGKVSFKVNLDSVARSGVHVSPSVLLLAHGKGAAP